MSLMMGGLQFEPLGRSLVQHGPWHYRDARFTQEDHVDLGAAILHAAAIPGLNTRLSQFSKASKPQRQSIGASKGAEEPPSISKPPKCASQPGTVALSPLIAVSTVPRALAGPVLPWSSLDSKAASLSRVVFTFPAKERPPPVRPSLKRRRPDSDVDGPNTASLGCKKRRLLRNLVTSRLSDPFSFPATHILTRESAVSGGKRFLKLAAIVAARRLVTGIAAQSQQAPAQHPQLSTSSSTSSLQRAAVVNRFRLRVHREAAERGDIEVADAAGDAALAQQSEGVGLVVGARFPPRSESATPPPCPLAPVLQLPHPNHAHPLPRASGARPSPPGSPSSLRPTEPTAPGLRLPPSPRLKPLRSPELRSTRPLITLDEIDDIDDENVAFPTSEHESRYDDEPDDVYADFGVIFGGGGDGHSSEDEVVEHFEDYMDDLDGIPWNARC
ncbi:hypothetical protein B0T24DRAFT_130416 [Lasiosphaeria ovina]|uniref:Uncharacterized protein n=1 Tax=Lasiosphaeria ovina TaxID=92902 RepID=A0AAE0MXH2_9PEZI|nr:hypothetical protein B0T24DRAFT_130416 [Lasiosphaeria ovina]